MNYIFLLLFAKGIIGPLDWKELSDFPEDSQEVINGKKVREFTNENNEFCNGTFIDSATFISAHHCSTKTIKFKTGAICAFIRGDTARDIAYFDCGNAGSNGLSRSKLVTEKLYILHYQCDWRVDTYCKPTLKYSPGKLLYLNGGFIGYDMDTLPGSSGAGIFNSNGDFIGVHNSYSERVGMNYGSIF